MKGGCFWFVWNIKGRDTHRQERLVLDFGLSLDLAPISHSGLPDAAQHLQQHPHPESRVYENMASNITNLDEIGEFEMVNNPMLSSPSAKVRKAVRDFHSAL